MKIGLFIKEELNETDIATYLISKINEHGFDFDNDNPDAVIYVGGDGTFLRAVHEYLDKLDDIVFAGINEGSVGYYPQFSIDEIDEILDLIDDCSFYRTQKLLSAKIGDKTIYAINEIRIENPFHTLICEVFVDEVFLETYRGNGLSVSTCGGSGAYNRSLGGAIVSPQLEAIQLTEIAPINNYKYRSLNSSLVLSGKETIILKGDFAEAVVGYDHLTISSNSNYIEFALSNKEVKVFKTNDFDYINKLYDTFIK